MSSKKKSENADWKQEEDPLQAIIIADSFNRKFAPVSYEKPRTLLPLGNKTLIDYTIEYLLEEEVREIIVFCCSFGEAIRQHVSKKWAGCNGSKIQCVMSDTKDCISLGDALREIDREGLIRSDFILVPGDLISNVKISKAIKEHRAKRKKEKALVMTSLYKKFSPGHFSRCQEEDSVMAIDVATKRLLHYQKTFGVKKLSFPTSLLQNQKEISIRYDLSPTHVNICSPQVAPLFTDNFDYQTIDDLIKGILINEEIMGDQVDIWAVEEGYSSRINDLHMYNAVSQDLMSRWTYPLVLESSTCNYKRNNKYIGKDVIIERNCDIASSVLIGSSTTIGESTNICRSTIGANCKIGNKVTINNSFIWDNTIIEDGCTITQTLICSHCHINRNVNLIDSILSFGVAIGEDKSLPPDTRISLLKPEDVAEQFAQLNIEQMQAGQYDSDMIGHKGRGYMWPKNETCADIEDDFIPSLTGNNYESESDSDVSDDDSDNDSAPPSPPPELSNLHQFQIEVCENLRCGISENISADNIALEINASKFKFNISIPELCESIVKSFLEISLVADSKQQTVKELEKGLTSLQKLLLKYYNNAESQLLAVSAAEDFFASRLEMGGLLATFLHKMYDKDIIDEQVILRWFNTPPHAHESLSEESYLELRKNSTVVNLIKWLQESDEEESDDSE